MTRHARGRIGGDKGRWSREAGANPARTRHCDRGGLAARAPAGGAATGTRRGPGRRGEGGPEARRPAPTAKRHDALVERGGSRMTHRIPRPPRGGLAARPRRRARAARGQGLGRDRRAERHPARDDRRHAGDRSRKRRPSCPDGADVLGALDAADARATGTARIYGVDARSSARRTRSPAASSGWVVVVNGRRLDDIGCERGAQRRRQGAVVVRPARRLRGRARAATTRSCSTRPPPRAPGQPVTVKATDTATTSTSGGNPNPTTSRRRPARRSAAARPPRRPAPTAPRRSRSPAARTRWWRPRATAHPRGSPAARPTGTDGFCGTTHAEPRPRRRRRTAVRDQRRRRLLRHARHGARPTARSLDAAPRARSTRRARARASSPAASSSDASGIADVRLRLTAQRPRRAADLRRQEETLVALKRCGAVHGRWFSVGDRAGLHLPAARAAGPRPLRARPAGHRQGRQPRPRWRAARPRRVHRCLASRARRRVLAAAAVAAVAAVAAGCGLGAGTQAEPDRAAGHRGLRRAAARPDRPAEGRRRRTR